jgi:hypothetical protein
MLVIVLLCCAVILAGGLLGKPVGWVVVGLALAALIIEVGGSHIRL